jgi:hypothetical protein
MFWDYPGVQIWFSIVAAGFKRALERYGWLTLCASLVEAFLFLIFGAFADEEMEKYMHFWYLMIPLAGFAIAFIFECGRAHAAITSQRPKNQEALEKIQQDWLNAGKEPGKNRKFRGLK